MPASSPRCRHHGAAVVDAHGTCTTCQREYHANIKRDDDARIVALQRALAEERAAFAAFLDDIEAGASQGSWTFPLAECSAEELNQATRWFTAVLVAANIARERIKRRGGA